jgi:transposase
MDLNRRIGPTPDKGEGMRIDIGEDLHKTQFTVYVRREGNPGESGQYPTSSEGYQEFLKQLGGWRHSGHDIRIGVESTGNTRYFKHRLEAKGYPVVVINTLKFKVINESVKKTDKHDAATIAEFLSKDMLPESKLCSETSEQLRRLLKVRSTLVRARVTVKNQIHGLLVSLGMEDTRASLQSKRGRQRILDTLAGAVKGLVVQPLFETIDRLSENVKTIEGEIEKLVSDDKVVELLQTIPGCGPITAWTIRAYTDDIGRFSNYKKYASYAGLAPWVQCSNETERYGRITKRGPEELRTAFVQLVVGIRRSRQSTSWRLMERYEAMKLVKGSGKSIIATARKMSKIVWFMLTREEEFNVSLMTDNSLEKKIDSMRTALNMISA